MLLLFSYSIFCYLVFIISFLLLIWGLICSFYNFLRWKVRLLIWDLSTFWLCLLLYASILVLPLLSLLSLVLCFHFYFHIFSNTVISFFIISCLSVWCLISTYLWIFQFLILLYIANFFHCGWKRYSVRFQSSQICQECFYSLSHGLSWKMFHVHFRRPCILLFLGGVFCICLLGQLVYSVFQVFCFLIALLSCSTITEIVILKFCTITVLLSITTSIFSPDDVYFIYLGAPMLGAFIFMVVI